MRGKFQDADGVEILEDIFWRARVEGQHCVSGSFKARGGVPAVTCSALRLGLTGSVGGAQRAVQRRQGAPAVRRTAPV